jgi:hypothetical protein
MNTIDYKIPKIEVKVDILIDEGDDSNPAPREFTLFLNEYSRYRKGQETIFEFLNKRKQFIPVKASSTKEFFALNLDDVLYVREQESFNAKSEQRQVMLFFRHSINLEVSYISPLPDSQSRLIDYLNQEGQFILFSQGDKKVFVNKDKIVRVKER